MAMLNLTLGSTLVCEVFRQSWLLRYLEIGPWHGFFFSYEATVEQNNENTVETFDAWGLDIIL